MKSDRTQLRIVCLLRDQYNHVRPVEDWFGDRAKFVYELDWHPESMLRHRPDLILCVNDYAFEIASCLDRARQSGIPSLCLQDGILEWRCQYENPLFADGNGAAQHQPVLADKIACIGNQSARHIAAWGNGTRTEVTGMPRLDALARMPASPIQRPGQRLLIMTAKNPGFTPEQTAVTLRSLLDVKHYVDSLTGVDVYWRVSRSIAKELGVVNRLSRAESAELVDILSQSDAVVTTMSTAVIEAMLMGRPVAVLDYHNNPQFVPTAWTISCMGQIESVIQELLFPHTRRMHHQNCCLDDCLERGLAAPRVGSLIERMIDTARTKPGRSTTSSTLVPAEGVYPRSVPPLAEFYPNHPVFAETDVQALQARLARSLRYSEQLEKRLREQSIWRRIYTFGRSKTGLPRPAAKPF